MRKAQYRNKAQQCKTKSTKLRTFKKCKDDGDKIKCTELVQTYNDRRVIPEKCTR